MHSK